MRFDCVHTGEELAALVRGIGFLPFFRSSVPGWSLEENVDPAVWFTGGDGPWEWKGRLARDKKIVYGKFYRGKAAFVSLTCFPDLCNFRRDGYDFEGFAADALAPHNDRLLMRALETAGPCPSKALKRICGFSKGYDTVLTRLQMQTFVISGDFVYDVDRHGRPYGWGNALLDFPERWLGEDLVSAADAYPPEESRERIVRWLRGWMPDVSEETLRRELRGK